jgi:hypothetical protein
MTGIAAGLHRKRTIRREYASRKTLVLLSLAAQNNQKRQGQE